MTDYENYGKASPAEPEVDRRVTAMQRVVELELSYEWAARDAKERAAKASKIQTELMNARNELYKLLGVEEPSRGIAVDAAR